MKGNGGKLRIGDIEFEIKSWQINGIFNKTETQLLKQYYEEIIYLEGMPLFEDFPIENKFQLVESLGYRIFKLNLAERNLYQTIKKIFHFETFKGFINN